MKHPMPVILLILCFSLLRPFRSTYACDEEDYPVEINTRSPLIQAIEAGNQDEVERLLDAGADIHYRHTFKLPYAPERRMFKNPLYYAIDAGKPRMVALLLAAGARCESTYHLMEATTLKLNTEESKCLDDGRAPLELLRAVIGNQVEILEMLLKYGIRLPEELHYRVVHYLNANRYAAAMKVLFLEGDLRKFSDKELLPLLNFAVRYAPSFEQANLLLPLIAPEAVFNENSLQVLHDAVSGQNAEVVRLLDDAFRTYLEANRENGQPGRDYNYYLKDLLMYSAGYASAEVFRIFAESKLHPLKRHDLAVSCLLKACQKNRTVISDYLVGKYQFTPGELGRALLTLAEYDAGPALETLIKAGAPVDFRDDITPLMQAVRKKRRSNVEVLLKAGADPRAKDNSGSTPLSWARSGIPEDIYRLLAEAANEDQRAEIQLFTVSSYINDKYSPLKLFDDDPDTCWAFDTQSPRPGHFVYISLDSPVDFDKIYIRKAPAVNGRTTNTPARISLQTGSAAREALTVQEDGQRLMISPGRIVRTNTIRLFITELNQPLSGQTGTLGDLEFRFGNTAVRLLLRHDTEIRQVPDGPRKISWMKHRELNPNLLRKGGSYIQSGVNYLFDTAYAARVQEYPMFMHYIPALGRADWGLNLDETYFDEAVAFFPVDDGHIFFFNTHSYSLDHMDILFLKIDLDGLLQERRLYSGSLQEQAAQVFSLPGGKFLISGYSDLPNTFTQSMLICVNDRGELLWQKEMSIGNPKPIVLEVFDNDHFLIIHQDNLYGFDIRGNCFYTERFETARLLYRSQENEILAIGNENYQEPGVLRFLSLRLNGDSLYRGIHKYRLSKKLPDLMKKADSKVGNGVFIFSLDDIKVRDIGRLQVTGKWRVEYARYDFIDGQMGMCIDLRDLEKGKTEKMNLQAVKLNDLELLEYPVREPMQRLTIIGTWENDPLAYEPVLHCNANRVRVRSLPDLQSETRGYLNVKDSVQVLKKSAEPMRIGPFQEYWYQIKKAGGLSGWVYGAYLGNDNREDCQEFFTERNGDGL